MMEEKWYTVKDAADYLGVSEPTIFRWMRDGTLSFFKVGNATRFNREGLDAVVEKSTGSKEAEAAAGRCSSCGHAHLVEGGLQGFGEMHFRPKKTKFWTLHEALVPVRARVCPACGHVQLHADAERLRKLMPGETPPETEA